MSFKPDGETMRLTSGSTFLLIALSALPGLSRAGNSFFVQAPVQSQVDAAGLGADACRSAGASVLRHQVAGDVATQLAGPPEDPTRLYTRPGQGSFLLTDAGSQWVTGVGVNQTVLAITETRNGEHGWLGPDYAGATQGLLTKPDLIMGRLNLPPVLMTRLPSPSLVAADSNWIALQIPASSDPSGLGLGLRLWRRPADSLPATWQTVADLPWSASSSQTLTDTGVTANNAYIYGLSQVYAWPGGSGAGADPSVAGQFITVAKGLSVRIVANAVQPTPTFIPTLLAPLTPDLAGESWVAYPNPLIGTDLRLAFKTEKDHSVYSLTIHALDGTKVLEMGGEAGVAGWQMPLVSLSKLASGIYLVHLRLHETGLDEKTLPVRKLAIVR
jgi:hypothetical protein